MKVSREKFLEVVRSYRGTPYRHLGRKPGEALDCAGLVLCALEQCGLGVLEPVRYGQFPSIDETESWLRRYGQQKPIEARQPGDVLATVYKSKLGHLAVVVDDKRVVQAVCRRGGGGRVAVLPFTSARSCWSLRGVTS